MSARDIVMAAAGQAGGDPLYVEDVFSTYLYTGNSSTQTITNGIDLAGEGGLVWLKERSASDIHNLYDTNRGVTKLLQTQANSAESVVANSLTAFNANGFSLGDYVRANESSQTYVSWTFRKAPKFFDVVTWTGNGTSPRAISHNLGSTPGMMIFKRTDTAQSWWVFHRSAPGGFNGYGVLNQTDAWVGASSGVSSVGSSSFTIDSYYNGIGSTYVAYLFAHDAGGFGEAGDQNVVSCGSFTTPGSAGQVVDLGWEPQYVLLKSTNNAYDWWQYDNMRGASIGDNANFLFPNKSNAESPGAAAFSITNRGIQFTGNVSGLSFIYLAIRRGPMKTPTSGTSVFEPAVRTGTGATLTTTVANFPPDLFITANRVIVDPNDWATFDRLRGNAPYLRTYSPNAEATNFPLTAIGQNGVTFSNYWNSSSASYADWYFRRAPGFFDVVCYTGTGVARTVNHNLGVAPELMIIKSRSNSSNWPVYPNDPTKLLLLDDTGEIIISIAPWNNTAPTSSSFTVRTSGLTNESGYTYVAYLFATLSGVSKVGSYTGTGTTLQINCGFTTGARFVMIKRTDSTGDWYVWDTARGIIAGNDPYLLLNSTAAEVTNTDYIDPLASGFEISSTAPAAINASGGSFIFLAIA